MNRQATSIFGFLAIGYSRTMNSYGNLEPGVKHNRVGYGNPHVTCRRQGDGSSSTAIGIMNRPTAAYCSHPSDSTGHPFKYPKKCVGQCYWKKPIGRKSLSSP